MDYLKAKGETHLRPEMRRLILWGMASPLLSVVGVGLVAAIAQNEVNIVSMALSCFALFGSALVVLWGIKEFSEVKKEPSDFLNLYRVMLILNSLLILYYIASSAMAGFMIRND
ncbi:MAG TPA: hypothetical protein PLB31_07515 [Fimbriimonadaceae bacterium]|nr:hypothetical protein [Fimbriimonadaceae bacterium]